MWLTNISPRKVHGILGFRTEMPVDKKFKQQLCSELTVQNQNEIFATLIATGMKSRYRRINWQLVEVPKSELKQDVLEELNLLDEEIEYLLWCTGQA